MYDPLYLTHINTHARRYVYVVPVTCVCILVDTTDSSAQSEGEKRWLDI